MSPTGPEIAANVAMVRAMGGVRWSDHGESDTRGAAGPPPQRVDHRSVSAAHRGAVTDRNPPGPLPGLPDAPQAERPADGRDRHRAELTAEAASASALQGPEQRVDVW
jgi:hypothetical protein